MTYAQAQNILDQRRAGQDMPPAVVDRALEMTGDLAPDVVRVAAEEMEVANA